MFLCVKHSELSDTCTGNYVTHTALDRHIPALPALHVYVNRLNTKFYAVLRCVTYVPCISICARPKMPHSRGNFDPWHPMSPVAAYEVIMQSLVLIGQTMWECITDNQKKQKTFDFIYSR